MVNARFDLFVCALRRGAPVALLAAALWLAATAGLRAAEAGPFFRIGTGSEAGSEFVIGQVLADVLQQSFAAENCGLPDCSAAPKLVAAQLSTGSLANLRDLRDGRLEAALVEAPIAGWAYRGQGPFEASGPMLELRAVATLYPVVLQVVTLERSGIRRIGDLRGRRVSLDGQGSGTHPLALRVLAAYGLGEGDIEGRTLEPGIALERLAAGRLDAFFALGGVPLEAVSRVNEIAEIRLLPVSAERLARDEVMAEATEMMVSLTLPAGAYAGLPEVETLAMSAQLLVREGLGEDLVYAMTARLWAADTGRRLRAAHPLGFEIAIDGALEVLEVPLHPGAERFYRERGLLP
jgi:TRAP transporter TAXI family solute receptor